MCNSIILYLFTGALSWLPIAGYTGVLGKYSMNILTADSIASTFVKIQNKVKIIERT